MSNAKLKNKTATTKESTRDKILAVATRLFACDGFAAVSTRKICEEAGANMAALHYHFETKEKLYTTILNEFSEENLKASVRTLEQLPNSLQEARIRLELYLFAMFDLFFDNPQLMQLIRHEIEAKDGEGLALFRNTFLKTQQALIDFIANSAKRGIFSKKVDTINAASMLLTHFFASTKNDELRKKLYGITLADPVQRRKWVDNSLEIFFHGVVGSNS